MLVISTFYISSRLTNHKFSSNEIFTHVSCKRTLTCTQNIVWDRSVQSGTHLVALLHLSCSVFCSVLFSLYSPSISSHPICGLPAPVILDPSLMCFTCISLPYSSSAPRTEAPVRLLLGARSCCENRAH